MVGSQGSTTTSGRRSTSPVESRRGNETVLPSPLRGAPGVLAPRPPLRRPVWISSFLMGRTMRVNVKGQLSMPKPVTSGVTQGSVLGPLLFLIYINHIAAKLTCKFAIFADDLKIYACGGSDKSDRTQAELEAEVQRDIDTLFNTSTSWGLFLNPKKCAVLRFSRRQQPPPHYVLDGNVLPSPKSQTDLGILVDTSLKFHDHISSVTCKVAGLGHSFLKSTVCRSRDFMLFFLTVHLRPILEYGSCLWHTGFIEDVRNLNVFKDTGPNKLRV